MMLKTLTISAALLLGCFSPAIAADSPRIVMEEFNVPAKDTGIELYVRNKHPAGADRFGAARTVLFVHGATYPAETSFDLAVGGDSWMDQIAKRGFDVYLVDLRGYGKSTRPKEMSEPADANGPIVTTETAIGDVGSAVDFILKRRDLNRLNLIGWSWGTTIMAGYTAANPAKVERLALYAPIWLGNPVAQNPPPKFGAYRTVQRSAAFDRWLRGVPETKKASLIPDGWFDTWWNATIATDPPGADQTPQALRAPNGVMHDIFNFWLAGKPLYEPSKITVPTILVVAEWDQDTPTYMAQTLFPLLTNAASKRLVVVGEGTHTLMLEKNRIALISEVQKFLEEGLPQ
jgi:pimeloyl-ACP methyl ester carboxylesterase